METTSVSIDVGSRQLILETGKMAKLANGAVTARYGDTIVLAAACAELDKTRDVDFLPLSVDYREKTSAAGRIPGGYIKREGRPTEKEILTARLTDRPLRPLFPDGYFYESQIMVSVLSADDINDPDILSIIASSAALVVSDIPVSKAVGAVRMGYIEGEVVVNPTHEQLENSKLDMMIAGTESAILMVEGHADMLPEEILLEALEKGHEEIKRIAAAITDLGNRAGKPKCEVELVQVSDELLAKVDQLVGSQISDCAQADAKRERRNAVKELKKKVDEALIESQEEPEFSPLQIGIAFKKIQKKYLRKLVLEKKQRLDGRSTTEIRPIACEVGLLPRVHGSSLFTRGETQALASLTLGGASDEQRVETLLGASTQKFLLHYNFPPYSVGEVRFVRGPSRRDIGHGKLAERALSAVLPSKDDFPYTIRITSDVLESNGSSSMATVCAGSMALMDAGVPISGPVAGVAMGLLLEQDQAMVLTDILGAEDHLGDMDFKLTGNDQGISAFQMDIKVEGITRDIMKKAMEQAKEARLIILGKMTEAITSPRDELSEYAPSITSIFINPEKISILIGPGGKNIRRITEECEVQIDVDDSGRVDVLAVNQESGRKAIEQIELLTADPEIGKIYRGTVKTIVDFGCFVEIMPGKEGLVHISRLSDHRVNRVEDEVKVGDEIMVKCFEIDHLGRINLSRKSVLNPDADHSDEQPGQRPDGPPRGGGGRDRRGGSGGGGRRR